MLKVGWMIFCFLIAFGTVCGQKQANIWYFGDRAGLDFNTIKPTPLSSSMTATEACASIADANGKLLFYTNGVTVWNSMHAPMPNGSGLKGNNSSTQCIIVPMPGNTRMYYIFTMDCEENYFKNGLCYSVVDMNKDNGLGDIVSKNNLLMAPMCEKVTACQRKDRNEFWIVTHKWNSDSFYTFRLTSTGITGLPVISHSGDVIKEFYGDPGTAIGYMKISSDGKKLAAASHQSGICEVFNFNDATGQVGSRIFKTQFSLKFTYGVEFSPNSQKLYLTVDDYGIFQYDLSVPLQAVIQNSKTRIYPLDTTKFVQPGALQLAPDHKIYVAMLNANALDVIQNPDASGMLNVKYKANAVNIGGVKCYLGLPDFIKPFFHPAVTAIDTCYGSDTKFSLSDTLGIDSLFWNFGDTTPLSKAFSPYHNYKAPGMYRIKLVGYASGHKDSVSRTVSINIPPENRLDSLMTICGDDTIQIDAYCEDCLYHWSDSSEGSFIATSAAGKYWVRRTRGQCVVSDTIWVRKLPKPTVRLGRDTLMCMGEKLILRPHTSDALVRQWQNNSQADSLLIDKPGKYFLTVSNNCGQASDTINVYYIHPPQVHFGKDTLICGKPDFWLDATSDSATYTWQDSSNNAKMHVTSFGIYSVTVKNHCGLINQSISVRPKSPVYIELGRDTDLCAGAVLKLHAKGPNAINYLWQDSSKDSVYVVKKPGRYKVTVSNSCSEATDSIYVDYTNPPDPHFNNDTLVCGQTEFTLDATSDKATYLWTDGSRRPTFTVTSSGTYSVFVKNHCGSIRKTIKVKMSNPPVVHLGNDSTICDSITLVAGDGSAGYRYHWQDGSKGRKFKVSASGTYSVSVTNECGTVYDTIALNVEQCECPLYTPNTFTPNDDGINETFKPGTCNPKEYVMRIFNRWGEELFETSDINTGWDGRFEGALVPEGAYLYTIRGANKSSGFFNKSGIVYVLLPKR